MDEFEYNIFKNQLDKTKSIKGCVELAKKLIDIRERDPLRYNHGYIYILMKEIISKLGTRNYPVYVHNFRDSYFLKNNVLKSLLDENSKNKVKNHLEFSKFFDKGDCLFLNNLNNVEKNNLIKITDLYGMNDIPFEIKFSYIQSNSLREALCSDIIGKRNGEDISDTTFNRPRQEINEKIATMLDFFINLNQSDKPLENKFMINKFKEAKASAQEIMEKYNARVDTSQPREIINIIKELME
jgi:hypothetical protein